MNLSNNKSLYSRILIFMILIFQFGCAQLPDAPEKLQQGKIQGKVTDSKTKKVLAGVSISTKPPTKTVQTNTSGSYVIDHIDAATYTIKANKSGYEEGITTVTVTAGETITANIRLSQKKGSISGKVTDAASGNGISGVTITTIPATQTVTTNSNGEYTINNITPGSYTVKANKSDYGEGKATVTVTAGGTATANIRISQKKGSISGKVTDATSGNGISGVTITTIPATQTVTTNSNGEYTISNITPGSYTVKANKVGYLENTATVEVTAGETLTANIQISQKKGSVSGKVTDAISGNAISRVTITTTPATQTVTTNSSGNYTISNIAPRSYTIKANKSGYGEVTATVTVTAGETVTANIQISQKKGSISGKVTDATSGNAISGVTISTTPATQTITTNSSGNYTISNITPGSYTVKANKVGYLENTATVEVTAGKTVTANIQLGKIPEPPILSSPPNGSQNQTTSPTLSWNESNGATSYRLQISTSSDFSSYVYNQGGITGTSQEISGLSYSTEYYWRVSAINGYGTSSYSVVWNFMIVENKPDLIASDISFSPSSGPSGTNISINLTVRNQGNGSSRSCYVKYYASTNTLITKYDTYIGQDFVSSLGAGSYSNESITWTVPSSLSNGYYYIGCIVDAYSDVTESDENNNTSYSSTRFLKESSSFVCGSSTVDYGGKLYNTVEIGSQCWLKQNLNIGNRINSDQNQTSGNGIEKYCYNNLESNCDTYGGLYQWNEAMKYSTTEGAQGICPTGWHIPTYAEMQTLETYVNDEAKKLIDENAKSGYTYTNETGFSALFAGGRNYSSGNFFDLDYVTDFWSSTENSSNNASQLYLRYNNSDVNFYSDNKNYGFSVRCLKDFL